MARAHTTRMTRLPKPSYAAELGKAITTCHEVPGEKGVKLCMVRPEKLGRPVNGPNDACRVLKHAANKDRESFYALYLNVRNEVLGIEEAHRGTLTGVDVHPREVFKGAMLANAAAVIVAHNHPSGDAQPSRDDLALTKRLVKAGEMLGVPVLDHLVVTRKGCDSIHEGHPRLFSREDE
jgi:DNA repair protein RadC